MVHVSQTSRTAHTRETTLLGKLLNSVRSGNLTASHNLAFCCVYMAIVIKNFHRRKSPSLHIPYTCYSNIAFFRARIVCIVVSLLVVAMLVTVFIAWAGAFTLTAPSVPFVLASPLWH